MPGFRVLFAFPAVSLLLTLLVIPSPAMASVSQCNNNSGSHGYQWMGLYTTNFANQGVLGHIDVDNLKVANPDNQHALVYISSQSQNDPNAAFGADWVQVGYGVGVADTAEVDVNHVYMEKNDYTTGPNATYYGYNTGNQPFSVYFDGETDGNGRGFYDGTYGSGSNFHIISKAWHVNPTKVQFWAQFEGATYTSSLENCPLSNWTLWGSTGDINNVQKTANTELTLDNTSSTQVDWSSSIATTYHFAYPGNYNEFTYAIYDLFKVWGS
jgi:hypothetical protein